MLVECQNVLLSIVSHLLVWLGVAVPAGAGAAGAAGADGVAGAEGAAAVVAVAGCVLGC